jgi:hypothetical protein
MSASQSGLGRSRSARRAALLGAEAGCYNECEPAVDETDAPWEPRPQRIDSHAVFSDRADGLAQRSPQEVCVSVMAVRPAK